MYNVSVRRPQIPFSILKVPQLSRRWIRPAIGSATSVPLDTVRLDRLSSAKARLTRKCERRIRKEFERADARKVQAGIPKSLATRARQGMQIRD